MSRAQLSLSVDAAQVFSKSGTAGLYFVGEEGLDFVRVRFVG